MVNNVLIGVKFQNKYTSYKCNFIPGYRGDAILLSKQILGIIYCLTQQYWNTVTGEYIKLHKYILRVYLFLDYYVLIFLITEFKKCPFWLFNVPREIIKS